MNEIIALAMHDLMREDDRYSVILNEKLLEVGPAARLAIDTIYNLYNRRTSKSHGKFTKAEGSPTERQIREYIEAQKKDFIRLTARMMDNLAREAGKKPGSEGGHVFFAHFARENNEYILVTIVTEKLRTALNEKRDLQNIETLDLDGFRFAGRINLTAWNSDQDRYLSFLKGKGAISDYFRDFLGCDSAILERKDTQALVGALKEFTVAENMSEKVATAFLSDAKNYLGGLSKAKEPVEFGTLANRLFPDDPDKLSAFLAETDRHLNEGFVPNASAIKTLVRLTGKTEMWTVEFSREAIDKSAVRYDQSTNSLTLFDVPNDMLQQMLQQGMIKE